MSTKTWQQLSSPNRLIALKQTSRNSNYILKKQKTQTNSLSANTIFWTVVALFDLVMLIDLLYGQAKIWSLLMIILSGS